MILNELKLIATVTLDFYTNNIKTINVKQCDTNSRFILASFTDHGKKVALNKDTMSVITRYKKADGKFGLRDCDILEDGTVLIETNEQMLAVAGRCRLDIVILESNGLKVDDYCDVSSLEDIDCAVLSTMPLDLNVVASPISKDELESEYDFTALNSALFETKEAERDLLEKQAEWTNKESERQANEASRQAAETERKKNVEDVVSQATVATTAATNAANDANDAATNANTAATNANTEAQNCKNVYQQINADADAVIAECETARNRANAAAQECESIVDFTGVVMQSEKGVAGGVAILDADGKVPNEQLKIPVKNGTGANSIVIGEGNAEGDFSFTGGTTDTTIAMEMFGSIIGTLIGTPDAAHGKGDMSFAYGAGVKALTAGTMAVGVNSIAGAMGFYWHSFDFTTTDSDGNVTPTIILSTKQAPKYKYTVPIIGTEKTANETSTWTTDAASVLANWAVGDVISIVNDHKYANCSTIKTIDSTNGKITVDSLPFTESTANADTVLSKNFDDYTIYVPSRPTAGIVNLCFGSFALGYNNKAAGSFATAIGYENIAGSDFAFVTGKENKGSYASLIGGTGNIATKANAFAAGNGNTIRGNSGAATGAKNTVNANYGTATGAHNTVNGTYGFAEGDYCEANGSASHAMGIYSVASGAHSYAGGNTSVASSSNSYAMGLKATASGKQAHAQNNSTIASGQDSHAEGWATQSTSYQTHAEGAQTRAMGMRSHAEGYNTIVLGTNSHVEGYSTKTLETILSDIIDVTTATDDEIYQAWSTNKFGLVKNKVSHGEGEDTLALGEYSHAEGYQTVAGYVSHSEGWNTEAKGQGSHSEGRGTKASSEYQHVQGKWNEEDTENKYAHIVGSGTSDTDRKNIHTVDWDGNGWFPSLSLGGTCDNPKVSLTYNEDTGRLVISVN